jgi:hypothetical protein
MRALLQLFSDAMAVTAVYVAVRVGLWVHDQVLAAAGVGYGVGRSVSGAAGQIDGAAHAASTVPMIGNVLSAPFGKAGDALSQVADQGTQAGAAVAWWALPIAVAVTVVPLLLLLPWWAFLRVRFTTRAASARRAWIAADGTEVLALRALTTMPPKRLAALGPGLVGRWRQGDPEAIELLAAAYLRRI